MPILGAFSKILPAEYRFYTFNSASATMPNGTAGGVFEVPGSRVTYPVNTVKNITATAQDLWKDIVWTISGINKSTSADNFSLELQWSSDGGSTFNSYSPAITWTAPGAINDMLSEMDTTTGGGNPVNFPVTSLIFRIAFTSSANPTTADFTVANIAATLFFAYLA